MHSEIRTEIAATVPSGATLDAIEQAVVEQSPADEERESVPDKSQLADGCQRAARLQDASMRDPLTGVGNRQFGESVLAGWFEQHLRFQRRFGVLFGDLDNFKLINDRIGPSAGERALELVARTLADNLRHDDHVVRWQGEEFVILVGDADEATLGAAAERIQMLVTRTRLLTRRHHVSLSISLGGTIVAPGDNPERIIGRADALLYQSKAAGRNRASLAIDHRPNRGREPAWPLPHQHRPSAKPRTGTSFSLQDHASRDAAQQRPCVA